MSTSPSLEALLAVPPYGLPQAEKRAILTERARELTRLHYRACPTYRDLLDRIFGGAEACEFEQLEDAPFLPVSLFKTRNLLSVEITSKDVAELVMAMLGKPFAKTTGAQVPIDGGNDRVI